MELPAKYDPALTEDKWYAYWLENKFFHSEPDEREPYTIVIPPPNVTGILHMGHVLNNTLNDVLIRKARMDGKNACWVPGTDHASIATENKEVQKPAAERIKKEELTREQFHEHPGEWKEQQSCGVRCKDGDYFTYRLICTRWWVRLPLGRKIPNSSILSTCT